MWLVVAGAVAADVVGVVVDPAGEPVPHALVTLASPLLIGAPVQREADARGRFVLPEVPEGTVFVQKPGYVGAIVTVSSAAEARVVLVPGIDPPLTAAERKKTVDTRGDYPLCGKKTDVPNPCGTLQRVPSGMTYQEVVGSRATPPPADE